MKAALIVVLVGLSFPALADDQIEWQRGSAGVYFSPRGGCTDAVVRVLGGARHTVRVLAYSFTSDAISDALVTAEKRGVDVKVVLDRSNLTGRFSDAPALARGHVPTLIDSAHAIAHNKVIVVDGETVLTGSFNFTNAAEAHNAENLLVLRSPYLAAQYLANWEKHRGHSKPYRRGRP